MAKPVAASRERVTSLPELFALDIRNRDYAVQFVDGLLSLALKNSVSDIHLQPTATGLQIDWRIDGVLQRIATFPPGEQSDVVTRLKAMAQLLTYRQDLAQEGRIAFGPGQESFRLCTMPTIYGERAAIRLLVRSNTRRLPNELGLPADILASLEESLQFTSGIILIVGPAGSGKTTTAYAGLRRIVEQTHGARSILSLEDPVEALVDGAAQSQVDAKNAWSLVDGLRSSLRQDPEVIFVSEIRDASEAELIFQAGLSGQLVISTMHAGSAVEAIRRLMDMGIKPFQLRSGLRLLIMQQLVRKLCECATKISDREQTPTHFATEDFPAILDWKHARQPAGCSMCSTQTTAPQPLQPSPTDGSSKPIRNSLAYWSTAGFRDQILIAEQLPTLDSEFGEAVQQMQGSQNLQRIAEQTGMMTLKLRAVDLIQQGQTSVHEILRVLGPRSLA